MATPTANYLVGKVVGVSADGAQMYATKGDVTRSIDAKKVTNARSAGFQQLKPGIAMAKGSVECVYNGDDPPTLALGDEVDIVWTPTGGTARTLQALITEMKESFVVDGDYTYSFNWESSGSFTL
jgi:hypothetical protein